MKESLELINEIAEQTDNLLDHYQPESSVYFSSSHCALLAQPPFASLLVTGMKNLSQQVNESLRLAKGLGFHHSLVVGAIPFDVNEKTSLRVCTNVVTENRNNVKCLQPEQVNIGNYTISAYPGPSEYLLGVKEALRRFAQGKLDKVVLSRTLEVCCEDMPNVRAIVKNLSARNTHGYTFAVDLKDIENERGSKEIKALIGASPELLISRRGSRIVANPLAGSEPRSKDPETDKSNAQKLLSSAKDRYEHALVVKAIKQNLGPYCKTLNVPSEPSLIQTATMWHLSTCIEGELLDTRTSSLTLALAMHPTPAVCGYPQEEARAVIKEIEPHYRGLFTGMIGWCDCSGDGEWVVTIRCAEVSSRNIRLYAGAGIVPGSDPDKELAETEAKFKTMLHAMGI